jgi:nucleoside-diphosphate-sugar epimerase
MLATDSKIERVVVAGSYAEYGKAGLRYGKIPANAPLEPTDPYAASKAAASIAMAAYARNMKTQLFYGRIFSAYGERQYEKNFWQQLRHAAINGNDFDMTLGEQIRDFIHVECVTKIFLRSCCQTEIINGVPLITNIASGNPISLADFAREWWGKFNAKGALNIGSLPYRENEVMTYVAEVDPSI